ncbi:choice-of-anchor I family protein [Thiorhodococcus minor]|uniref:Alkaline phosphatase n=1 Tax=Thiorhodococcus minor TaxID=57489 RepID=A0A6M0K665_9GAMM|nr:choice-of-anchor I family protein [Thiorhodococcus minor]NEV64077.1 alkaline phosphatase [Thiorhodococcus minor]
MKRLILAVLTGLAATQALAFGVDREVTLTPIGTYASGVFDEGAAEIVSYDPKTRRAFVVNANDATVDVLDISDPTAPTKIGAIDVGDVGSDLGAANSVAVKGGLVAVAVEADPKQNPGIIVLYDAAADPVAQPLATFPAGALPDAVTFSPDGKTILAVNEGEPNDDYSVDPEGSITIIDIKRGIDKARVTQVDFTAFNDQKDALIAAGVRIFGPGATVAKDLEPEFAAIHPDGVHATVVLQENNAFAQVNLRSGEVKDIVPLGYKDHRLVENALDPSNRDDAIAINNWPVYGMYQPDGIAAYRTFGGTYLVTAGEGDSRDYDGYSEEERVKDVELDPDAFPNAEFLQENENLGRLNITTANGDTDDDGDFDELYAYGSRSLSIWDRKGRLVWDSGSELEDIIAAHPDFAEHFNCTNDDNDCFDNRSDDKGPEPEGVVVGQILGRQYAFVGLERIGGIMVYDVTNPRRPVFETYVNNRDFSVDVCNQRDDEGDCMTGEGMANAEAKDLGPEGLAFIPWWQSPSWKPLLLVGNEISGTTTVFEVDLRFGRK